MGNTGSIYSILQLNRDKWPNKTYIEFNDIKNANIEQMNLHKIFIVDVKFSWNIITYIINLIGIGINLLKYSLNYNIINSYVEVRESDVRNEDSIKFVLNKVKNTFNYLSAKEKGISDIEYVTNIFTELKKKTNGIFAKRDIPANTLICRAHDYISYDQKYIKIGDCINDLNFYNFMQEYEYCDIDNIDKYTNVKFMVINNIWYVYSIKEIKKGEELSKLYYSKFWFDKLGFVITNWEDPAYDIRKEERNSYKKFKESMDNLTLKCVKISKDEFGIKNAEGRITFSTTPDIYWQAVNRKVLKELEDNQIEI